MTVRVVVVGGGIAGMSVAFGLMRRGAAVTVVDAAHVGQATAAGAGILEPWGSAATGAFYDLYARGAAFYPSMVAALAHLGVTQLGYPRTGALVVSRTPADVHAVAARLALRRRGSPEMGEVARLSGAALVERFPPLRDDLDGLWIGGAARVAGRPAWARPARPGPHVGGARRG